MPNNRIMDITRSARPTRKGEARLLATHLRSSRKKLMNIDGIDMSGFAGARSLRQLHKSRCADVPVGCGVYVLLRESSSHPRFRSKSNAGWFKGLDPSYPISIAKEAWAPGAQVVYVGKAAGAMGLRQRLRQLVDFGFGKPIGHRGGRLLWHLSDHAALRVHWKRCGGSQADRLETRLINHFRKIHGKRPFANRAK